MSTRMLVDARHPEETRVTVVKGSRVEDFDYESSVRRQLKGNIYLARVTRVEPSLQAAFVEYGGNRHGFLAFSEIHPDYYQIPLEDREAIIEEETQAAAAEKAAEEDAEAAEEKKKKPRRRRGRKSAAEKAAEADATVSEEAPAPEDNADSLGAEKTFGDQEGENESSDKPSEENAESADTDGPSETTGEEAESDDKAAEDDDAEQSDVKESDEDDKEAEIEAAAASRKRNLRALKRRYSIQEVIKRRQVLLIQVVKEERGNKGAALTTYMSLAGRYCVLMPNSTHSGGISRKISNVSDRKKLKQIIGSLNVPEDMGLIVRTAGINRTKTEIKRDYDYLLRLWNGIRDLTLKSTAPALIYEEGNLIKRTIRDVYTRDIDEIWVEGEKGYRAAKDFMKLLMPSHAKKVQHYKDRIPLYHRYQVENQLEAMYQPVVQLKSGGYIVINPTEALISIDVNSGRATKEHNIEETAVKTNLEAAEEVARQLRLRDMAGLVVIDFIDMEDRGNNRAVERRMKEVLKSDRARIQVGRISSFGLMEMSRQRLRPNLLEVAMETCNHCAGTGLVRSVESAALMALRLLEEEGIRNRSSVVRVAASQDVAIYLLNQKRSVLSDLEAQYKFTIQVLAQSNFGPSDIELTRETGSEGRPDTNEPVVVKVDSAAPSQGEEETQDSPKATADKEDQPRKKRRRRRRRRRGAGDDQEVSASNDKSAQTSDAGQASDESDASTSEDDDSKKDSNSRRRRGSRGGRRRRGRDEKGQDTAASAADDTAQSEVSEAADTATPSEAVADGEDDSAASKQDKPARRRRRVKKKANSETADSAEATAPISEASSEGDAKEDDKEKPAKRSTRRRSTKKESVDAEATTDVAADAGEAATDEKPKRRRRKKADDETLAKAADSAEATTEEKPKRRRAAPRKKAEAKTDSKSEAKAAKTKTKEAAEKPKEAAAEARTGEAKKAEPAPTQTAVDPNQPKKKGWWQRTFG